MTRTQLLRKSWHLVLCAAFACTAPACDQTSSTSGTAADRPGPTGGEPAKSKAGTDNRASVEPGRLPIGPYKMIQLSSSDKAPWYLLPFDKTGACEAPLTRASAVESMKTQNYTDVFIFSHGWNNDWNDANRLYDGWINGFIQFRRDKGLDLGREFRPLFVGIIWPSTALVLPSEQGPGFRSARPDDDAYVGQERDEIRSLAEVVPDAQRNRFYQLTQRPQGAGLSEADALELAKILAPLYKATDKETGEDPAPPAPPTWSRPGKRSETRRWITWAGSGSVSPISTHAGSCGWRPSGR